MTELMISILLLSIIATYAVPSFTSFFSRTHVRSAAKALEDDIRLGSAEARTRVGQTSTGSPVTLCPYNDAQTNCAATSLDPVAAAAAWLSNGWLLFVDANGNSGFEAGDTLLKSNTDHAKKNFTFSFSNLPSNNRLLFSLRGPQGANSSSPVNFTFTATDGYIYTISMDHSTGQTTRQQG